MRLACPSELFESAAPIVATTSERQCALSTLSRPECTPNARPRTHAFALPRNTGLRTHIPSATKMLVSRRSSGERLERMLLTFDPLHWPEDAPTVVAFLASNEWPFHPVPLLSPTDAEKVSVEADDIATFWIRSGDEAVGLIRLLDLDDLDVGSPLFDLRVADGHRGLGVGRQAVRWLTDHLFTTYPELHRIEATTRVDNQAMQRVFAHCSWRLEGRFVEAWTNADGTRSDALSYAILRRDYSAERELDG